MWLAVKVERDGEAVAHSRVDVVGKAESGLLVGRRRYSRVRSTSGLSGAYRRAAALVPALAEVHLLAKMVAVSRHLTLAPLLGPGGPAAGVGAEPAQQLGPHHLLLFTAAVRRGGSSSRGSGGSSVFRVKTTKKQPMTALTILVSAPSTSLAIFFLPMPRVWSRMISAAMAGSGAGSGAAAAAGSRPGGGGLAMGLRNDIRAVGRKRWDADGGR